MDKKLQQLNNKLIDMQEKLLKEMIQIDDMLVKRVNQKNDILCDYEIEIEISFYLNEDHPLYKKDEDNIITTITECIKGISQKDDTYPYVLTINHNEFCNWNHPMKDEYHCWWYHCLYDHNNLSWEDMKKIGNIWSDIKVQYQYVDNIT